MLKYLCFKNTFSRTDVINHLQFLRGTLLQNAKHKHPTLCKSYHCSSNRPFKVKSTRNAIAEAKSDIFNVNTNVQNNVILYKYVNNTYVNGLRFFTYGWLVCAALVGYYSYSPTFISFWSKCSTWKEYLIKNGMRIFYFLWAVITAPCLLYVMHFSTRRFIKYIILHKGGQEVSIITNHLFKNELLLRVPVHEVKVIMARMEMSQYLPLKVQSQYFFYLIDKKGKFYNENLFDNTVGVKRDWTGNRK